MCLCVFEHAFMYAFTYTCVTVCACKYCALPSAYAVCCGRLACFDLCFVKGVRFGPTPPQLPACQEHHPQGPQVQQYPPTQKLVCVRICVCA